jgi:flagellum-specific peptidoglycan hydrolase FlgJ|tara:strand:+ start:14 stop:601 length:588 start_codon:yes stop_codon:yes gene_type:complete
MLYTYCKESLSYRKVTPTRKLGIVALAIFASIYLSMTSMVTTAKQQAYKEAFNLPAETELVILDTSEDQFSRDKLVKELKRLNVRYPHIVLAQSILETGYWESRIYQENNNLFGMKQARARATTAKGTQLGHAYYNSWKESVTDYALYQAAYLNKLRTEKKYLNYLDKNYAEAKNYDNALLTIIEREKLKELFLD